MFDNESMIIEGKRFPLGTPPERIAKETDSDMEVTAIRIQTEMKWHTTLNRIGKRTERLQKAVARAQHAQDSLVKSYSRRELPPA